MKGFNTPSKKAELFSPSLAQLRDAEGRPIDPLSGQAVHKEICVKVYPVT